MFETERKFLINQLDFIRPTHPQTRIVQGFLNTHPDRTVRVRIAGNQAFLTVKGRANPSGITRFEWEIEIPLQEAEQLLALCEKGVIHKTRYLVPVGKNTFEIDVFHDENNGLLIAEIELETEEEEFEKPAWLGREVTNDPRYYNSYLSQHPFADWDSDKAV